MAICHDGCRMRGHALRPQTPLTAEDTEDIASRSAYSVCKKATRSDFSWPVRFQIEALQDAGRELTTILYLWKDSDADLPLPARPDYLGIQMGLAVNRPAPKPIW
jgi:hypothetical protein